MRRAVLATLCLALLPAGAAAAGAPAFPKSYSGTISGTYAVPEGGSKVAAAWKITSVKFRLVHIRYVEGGWTAYYKVAAGTVAFHEAESGTCSYVLDEKLALRPAMPRPNPGTPFYINASPSGPMTYGGSLALPKVYTVTESCAEQGQDPSTQSRKLQIPDMFQPASPRARLGRRLQGHRSSSDDFSGSKTTWAWTLKPGR